MRAHFLDPKTDVAFKRVFGTPGNEDILLHFLNDVLEFSDDKKIESLELLPVEQLSHLDADGVSKKGVNKTTFLDVLCKDRQEKQYIVEMQVDYFDFFKERIVLYGANAYGNQLKRVQSYSKLKDVYTVSVLNFSMLESPDFISHHHFANVKTNKNDFKGLYFTVLELTKFKKELHECVSMLDKWCYFFKKAEESRVKDIDSLSCGIKPLKRAYEELEDSKWSKLELMRYEEAHFRDVRHKKSLEDTVAREVKEALVEKEKEVQELKLEMELKMEESKKQQKLEIAKTFLDNGLDLGSVSKSIGLTPQEITDYLQNSNGHIKV
jgi:predicted transposase/invertase (TIGR01784 family)